MRERVKAILAVIVTNAGGPDAPERHGFDEQMNVHLIDRTAAEGQARQKLVDRLRVTAEEDAGKRLRMFFHLTNGGIDVCISDDWEDRPKDFILHDRIVPGDWIKDRGI